MRSVGRVAIPPPHQPKRPRPSCVRARVWIAPFQQYSTRSIACTLAFRLLAPWSHSHLHSPTLHCIYGLHMTGTRRAAPQPTKYKKSQAQAHHGLLPVQDRLPAAGPVRRRRPCAWRLGRGHEKEDLDPLPGPPAHCEWDVRLLHLLHLRGRAPLRRRGERGGLLVRHVHLQLCAERQPG